MSQPSSSISSQPTPSAESQRLFKELEAEAQSFGDKVLRDLRVLMFLQSGFELTKVQEPVQAAVLSLLSDELKLESLVNERGLEAVIESILSYFEKNPLPQSVTKRLAEASSHLVQSQAEASKSRSQHVLGLSALKNQQASEEESDEPKLSLLDLRYQLEKK